MVTQRLAELDRLRVTRDVFVAPLPTIDAARLVELIGADSDRAPDIVELAGGNPLFAEELCHLAMTDLPAPAGRSVVPRVVAAAFDHRRSLLGEDSALAFGAAAVLGRGFSVSMLAAVAPTLTDTESAVDDLVARDLLVEVAPGQFALRHALFGAAAIESMTPSQRSAMHRSVAIALESGAAGRPELRAGELLRHWLEVGERLGDSSSVGGVLDLIGWTNYTLSDLHASSDAYRRGIAANQSLTSAQALASCEVLVTAWPCCRSRTLGCV